METKNNKEAGMCHFQVAASSLSEDTIRRLAETARSGFGSAITYEDAKNHLLSGGILHVFGTFDSENLVGFVSYNLYHIDGNSMVDIPDIRDCSVANGKKVLYVNGMVVKEVYQGHGLLSASLESVISAAQPTHLILRTQNPVSYHILSKLGTTYPSFEAPAEEAVEIAAMLASKLKMTRYASHEFVERGTYGTPLYGKPPESKDKYANRLFTEKLNIDIRRWRFCYCCDGTRTQAIVDGVRRTGGSPAA